MPDREKVIKGLSELEGFLFKRYGEVSSDETNIWYDRFLAVSDALDLLKEQQKQIEQMNFIYGFVYGGQVKEIKELVRCKDCKYRFVDGDNVRFNMCLLNHNKVQSDDWFCADGERQEGR